MKGLFLARGGAALLVLLSSAAAQLSCPISPYIDPYGVGKLGIAPADRMALPL